MNCGKCGAQIDTCTSCGNVEPEPAERTDVEWCDDCPFLLEEGRCVCTHPIVVSANGNQPRVFGGDESAEPPDWCPLREHPQLIALKVKP